MAKQKGIINVSGKFGEMVGVISSKNGNLLRNAPTKTTKPKSKAFTEQSLLTGPISRLCGSIRMATEHYAKNFKSSSLVNKMKKRMRVPKTTERYLMLNELHNFCLCWSSQ